MIRTQISLSEEEYEAAKREAQRLGISLAELLRRALRPLLPADASKPWMRYAGFIESGVDQRCFRPVDARKSAVLFWGALHGLTQFKKLEATVLGGEHHLELYLHAVDELIEGLKTHAECASPSA